MNLLKISLLTIFLTIGLRAYAEVNVLECEVLNSYPEISKPIGTYMILNNKIFFNGCDRRDTDGIKVIDLNNFKIKHVSDSWFYGVIGDHLIITAMDEQYRIGMYEMNSQNYQIKKFEFPKDRRPTSMYFEYQNLVGFASEPLGGLALYDFNKGIYDDSHIRVSGTPNDISHDKMHLLYTNNTKSFYIYNIQKKETVCSIDIDYYAVDESAFFITNEIVAYTANGRLILFNIKGKEIGEFYFDCSIPYKQDIWIFHDINKAIFSYRNEDDILCTYLIDTTSFRDWLDENNLLFRPTTAVLNDSRVRVRENPNLEAQHLGYLNTGDEVEVFDRSGIKVQIGDMNDWWYKIRRKSDGLEGWAYGPFLDLAEEQGAIVPPVPEDSSAGRSER